MLRAESFFKVKNAQTDKESQVMRISIMPRARQAVLIVPVIAVLFAAGARLGTAQAPAATPETKQKEKKLEQGEIEAKRLLLLMDRDQSGKVSREEFMGFMTAEFERLDINKDGELDVKELTQTRLMPHGGTHR
jgi:hypothetical protein